VVTPEDMKFTALLEERRKEVEWLRMI